MHEDGIRLLNLMFRPGETICVSPNKYGYHSIPLENTFSGKITLVPPDANRPLEYCDSSELLLVALNPIHGQRNDANCKSFRNFLIELDSGPLGQQLEYAKAIGLPYSAVVFSGSKSLHFLVSLDQDVPTEDSWRHLSEWSLRIATMADQNTKNPSRSIRVPGAQRPEAKMQQLVEFKGPTSMKEFAAWLNNHPGAKPQKREKRVLSDKPDFKKIRPWVRDALMKGLDPNKGRNKQWFAIACDFALAGYSESDTFSILAEYFASDRDFSEREWRTSVRSGFKYIYENRKLGK